MNIAKPNNKNAAGYKFIQNFNNENIKEIKERTRNTKKYRFLILGSGTS